MIMTNTDFSFDSRPVEMTDIEIWRDGGTVSFTFNDAKGRQSSYFVGGALCTDAGQLFAGYPYARPAGEAELIAPDDPIHKRVVSAIERHLLYQVGTPEQQQNFERRGFVRDDIRIDNEQNREAWLLALALNLMDGRATLNNQN